MALVEEASRLSVYVTSSLELILGGIPTIRT